MLRRTLFTLTAALVASAALPGATPTFGEDIMTNPKTGFAPINGLELYYEIHGSGEPLLMLHGGIGASEQFGPNVVELAKTRQVIIAHMQGHGFTKDIDRPYDYAQFADDAAALLDYLKVGALDVLGYSLGAGVAQRLAIQHPDKVRKLVLVSGTMAYDGSYPEIVAAFPAMIANAAQIGAGVSQSPLAAMYPDVNWETAFRKTGELESAHWDWSDEMGTIKVPALLVFADADSVKPDHIVAMYQKFGGFQRDGGMDGSMRSPSRLAILPGTLHYNILETTAVAGAVEGFLANVSG